MKTLPAANFPLTVCVALIVVLTVPAWADIPLNPPEPAAADAPTAPDQDLYLSYGLVNGYVFRPAAKTYRSMVFEEESQAIHNMIENASMPHRLINSLLQGRTRAAAEELSRFLINTSLGVFGMADVAKYFFGIDKNQATMSQTLESWGWTSSATMDLALAPQMTFRDGLGLVVDHALSPANYFLPIPAAGAVASVVFLNDHEVER